MPSYDNKVLTGDQLVYFSGLVKTALASKADSSAVAGKQDALVFNTAYNASSNKVATMADIPASYSLPTASTSTLGGVKVDGSTIAIDANGVISATSSSDSNLTIYDGQNIVFDYYEGGTVISVDPNGISFVDQEDEDLSSYVGGMNITVSDASTGNQADMTASTISASIFTVPEQEEDSIEVISQVSISPTNITFTSGGPENQISHALSIGNGALLFDNSAVAMVSDITTALSGISSFSFEIVQSLPQSNISTSKIYLVAKQTAGTNQVYTEYAYVNNAWEIIGDTSMSIDTLSNQEVATIWSTATATT